MPEPLPEFVERRRPAWDELGGLIERAGGRAERLGPDGVRRLGRDYRQAAADLAQARRRWPGDPVTDHLEQLVARARPLVYGTVRERTSVADFALHGYWRRVRERPVFLLVAALALFGPALAMGAWTARHPAQASAAARFSPTTAPLSEGQGRDPDTEKITDPALNSSFSAQIFTNNARVALAAYAGGLTAGVFTVLSLGINGAIVGLVVGLTTNAGNGEAMWRLIAPHGFLELSLIVVAGAAGLRTGWALLHPGTRTRAEALSIEGRAGVEMALGTAVLLVPTGLVEGFVTPRGLSLPLALTVGIALAVAFWALVVVLGRPEVERPDGLDPSDAGAVRAARWT